MREKKRMKTNYVLFRTMSVCFLVSGSCALMKQKKYE